MATKSWLEVSIRVKGTTSEDTYSYTLFWIYAQVTQKDLVKIIIAKDAHYHKPMSSLSYCVLFNMSYKVV